MTLRRWFVLVPLILWWWIVWVYWDAAVPVLPTKVVDLPQPFVVIGSTPTDEVVTVAAGVMTNGARLTHSPLQFWSFPEGRLIREFELEGGFSDPTLFGGTLLRVKQDGRRKIFDFQTGELVEVFEAGVKWVSIIDLERRVVAFQSGTTLNARDLKNHRDLWSVENCVTVHQCYPDFIVAVLLSTTLESASPDGTRNALLDIATGEEIHHFEHLGPVQSIQGRSGSPYVLLTIQNDRRQHVCRRETGELLWSSTAIGLGQLSLDGEEIEYYTSRWPGRGTLVRWRCSDGKLLAAWPNGPGPNGWQQIRAPDFLLEDASFSLPVHAWVSGTVSWIQRWAGTSFSFPPTWRMIRIVDLPSAQNLGAFDEPSLSGATLLGQRSGLRSFVIHTANQLRYYTLPPTRNWSWLVHWGLLPPAGVILGGRLWRVVWRRWAVGRG